MLPQFLVIALYGLALGVILMKQGQPRTGIYGPVDVVMVALMLFLLWWGGFFNNSF